MTTSDEGWNNAKGWAMETTTVKAKAKDVDELQEDGRAAKGRSAKRGDRRETADVVGQENGKTADC